MVASILFGEGGAFLSVWVWCVAVSRKFLYIVGVLVGGHSVHATFGVIVRRVARVLAVGRI